MEKDIHGKNGANVARGTLEWCARVNMDGWHLKYVRGDIFGICGNRKPMART